MKDESLEDAARQVVVAMTRATHELVLAACGTSKIVERVREACRTLAARLALTREAHRICVRGMA